MVKCEICNKEFKSITQKHLNTHDIKREEYVIKFPNAKLYELLLKTISCYNCNQKFEGDANLSKTNTPCPDCKKLGFKGLQQEGLAEKIKQTYFKKTGYTNPAHNPEVMKKRKDTFKKNKSEDPNYVSNMVLKREETAIKNNGIDHVQKRLSKAKITLLEKTGYEYPSQNPETTQKSIKTVIENYGGVGLASPIIMAMHQKTISEKYDIPNITNIQQVPEIREKTTKIFQEKFGGNSPFSDQDIRDKSKQTCLERYGDRDPMYDPRVQEKIRNTSLKNCGETCWSKTPEGKIKLRENGLKYWWGSEEERIDRIKEFGFNLVDDVWEHSHFDHNWQCIKCNNVFNTVWNNIQQGYKCPHCFPRLPGTSIAEQEILEYVKSLLPENVDVLNGDRIQLKPKELDIYIPSLNIAIEYDSFYHHITKFIPPNYHVDKTNKCSMLGIKLIHIFEDEWNRKKDIVKSRLKNQFGIYDKRIHARKCIIKIIDPSTKNIFLQENHIQGQDSSEIKLGAFYQEELVSVMTFSHGNIAKGGNPKDKLSWELNRFASKLGYSIPGIASKLLSHFTKKYTWSKIFSYADRRWSDGKVYQTLGFTHEYNSGPNYWYLKNSVRINRFSLRKRPDEPKDITERELRLKEGYSIIYDCGNMKFSMINPNQQLY